MLTYEEALRRIFERTNFERGAQPPYSERVWRLERVEELLSHFGQPHRAYPSVHIAGTKGKGSTTAMIDSVLRAAGYRTGMYTSPHLHTFRERIRLGGELIPEADVAYMVERMRPTLDARPEVTVFELITALAMWYYAERQIDVGIFEVGLGGRLDATNVLTPLVSVITSISLDHVQVLGDTLAAIAREKAGIIKPSVPVVSAPQSPEAMHVIEAICAERQARLHVVGRDWQWHLRGFDLERQSLAIYSQGHAEAPEYPDVEIPLLGAHQLENACVAVAAIGILRQAGLSISDVAVLGGLADVQWPGRLEIMGRRPLVVVDGAHNRDSIHKLLVAVDSYLRFRRLVVVFGAGRTHDPAAQLSLLLGKATHLIVTQAHHPRAMPTEELCAAAKALGHATEACHTVEEAIAQALASAQDDDLVLITGSLFVVAEARQAWAAIHGQSTYPSDPPGIY
ncbi:MAG: bifunctional folylpolyglutamate synthase/dihydrofolate synthase [Anaerolineae bacterium]|nr:bifunctional folylpolyglutamate synthase/dihydrofolate synthase [Anaerolineae bacterium]